MKFILMFLVIFVAGPLAFWGLSRKATTKRYFSVLLGILVVAVALAFALARWAVPMPALSPYAGLLLVLLFWITWIIALSLLFLAARPYLAFGQAERWAFAVGAMATTLPWFGLYVAQMMAAR